MIRSHYAAGSGAVLVETREESRFLRSLRAELPGAEICSVAAPGGQIVNVKTGKSDAGSGLASGYKWLAGGPGRVLVCYDWHTLCNSPGHWRALIEALPAIRQPARAGESDPGSLAVFVGPAWDLAPANPLRGTIPVVKFSLPARAELVALATELGSKNGFPLNGHTEPVADALSGLTEDAATQAAAECLESCGEWRPQHLRASQRRILTEAKLEVRPGIPADLYGGMGQLRQDLERRVIPWSRDPVLAVRRMLWAGVHGCLHASTPIFDPCDGSTVTVQERHERAEAFHVIAINDVTGQPVIARAMPPAKYPAAQMVRVTFQDGQTMTVTTGHRFWNGVDYVAASTIAEHLRKSGAFRLPSISEPCLSALRQGAPRSMRTTPGSTGRCSSYRRRGDEQLPLESGIDRWLSPSQADSPVRDLSVLRADALEGKRTSNRRSESDRLATPDLLRQFLSQTDREAQFLLPAGYASPSSRRERAESPPRASSQDLRPCKGGSRWLEFLPSAEDVLMGEQPPHSLDAFSGFVELRPTTNPLLQRSPDGSGQQRNGPEYDQLSFGRSSSSAPLGSVSSYAINSCNDIAWNAIVKAEILDEQPYFDFHVPGWENYWAVGSWHHNTGKTLGAQLLAGMLGSDVIILSLAKLKGGIVGQSEGQLSAALECVSAISRESRTVVVLDEVDAIPKSGLDGGASSGMWTILGEWLQSDNGQAVCIGTTNRYDLLDTALTQRFGRGYFFDLPSARERQAIATIHFRRCGLVGDVAAIAEITAALTEGYSAREIGELIVPDVVAIHGREQLPDSDDVRGVVGRYQPTSVTQADQLAAVRKVRGCLLPANDSEDQAPPSGGRRIAKGT